MQRTKKLAINTILFAISNFGSKALSFLLVPFYTAVLNTEQYGTVDLVLTTVSLVMPLVTMSMSDAVLRFAMDKDNEKKDVFTTGICVIVLGNIASVFLLPWLSTLLQLRDYWVYVLIILFFNSLYSLTSQFCRGISKSIQFALGGIVQTAVLIVSNLILLLGMKWGIKGYLISLILSYALSFVFLFATAKLHLYFGGHIHKELLKKMLKYALPLIPNTIMWWVMNASDKLFIANILGKSSNGIYAVANKFPSIINMISVIFFQAWQLSAIEEVDATDRSKYYSTVFYNLSSVIMLGMSAILLFLKPIFRVWTADSYYIAWQYTPLLLFAVMFMCYTSFWGSNLVALKKTGSILKSAVFGGVANILLNAILIPKMGLYGAALATVVGFLITWVVRYVDGRKDLVIEINFRMFFSNMFILLLQTLALYLERYLLIEIVLFVIILFVNRRFICGIINLMAHTKKHILKK